MADSSAILTFHSIDNTGSVLSFDPEMFRTRMEALVKNGPPVVPLLECLRRPGTIALTFDDGFANFASEAWPVLRRLGLPATLFVVSGRVGRRNDWNSPGTRIPDLPLLDWPELRLLAEDGVELGAHSHTHAKLTALEGERLAEEFTLPLRLIEERTGVKPLTFAYPYGRVNTAVRTKAAKMYEAACGTSMGYWNVNGDLHEVERIDAYYLRGGIGLAEVLSPRGRRWVAARGWARRIKSTLYGTLSSAEGAAG